MLKRFIIFFALGVGVSMYLFLGGCGNIIIKVQKKSKASELQTVNIKKNAFESSDDFLAEIDSLKNLKIEEFFNTAKGKDFRDALRNGFRKYRSYLISKMEAPSDAALINFDPNWICANNKLNLNIEDINKFLGPILKVSALASLKEKAAKALNQNLADHIDSITALILGELGFKVNGNTQVEKNNESVITKANLEISLVPFDSDPIEIQEKDKKESLKIEFIRNLKNNDEGTFSGIVTITEKTTNSDQSVDTYKANIDIARVLKDKDNVLFEHTGTMILSLNDKETYLRSVAINQVDSSAQNFKVTDTIKVYGKDVLSKSIDVNFAEMCKVTKAEDLPITTKEELKKEDNTAKDKFEEIDKNPISNPDQNPSQNPVQK